MESENLKVDTPAQVGTSLVIPREIPRDAVHLSTELLGEGHFGTVVMGMLYPDDDTIVPYEIAAKILKQNVSVPNVAKERFHREAAISCQFKHRNIVGCIGVITVDEPSVIIMQCCGKGSLERVLVKDIAPTINSSASRLHSHLEKRLLGYAIDIATGLEHMHTKHFVHRDVAVRNVLVTATDVCVISVSLHERRHV